jgi:signal-transduction protein with cAMP-binding, CBS, and nucleotidyltransferase domain
MRQDLEEARQKEEVWQRMRRNLARRRKHAITYEALVNFSRNNEQRATLSEELKERGCGTLLSLLRLWWDACQLERNSTNSRLWSQYSQATALCLHDNI